jgi:hypothetical protein
VRGDWPERVSKVLVMSLVLLGILYAGDWMVLRFRIARGTAYGSVNVDQFLSSALKGNKTEYDFVGTVPKPCSRSLFPQQGNPACWWLERHKSQWE